MPLVTVSERGQIVIPLQVRKQLNIRPGKRLLLHVEGDQAVLKPLPDDPVEAFCGVFAEGPSLTKALLQEREKEKQRESPKSAG